MKQFDFIRVYKHALAMGDLRPDAMQEKAIQILMKLGQALLKEEHRPWFKKYWPRTPLNGLYLYGPVGSGKTYLMDLFYQHIPLERKGRLHFHEFMHSVHERLKEVRGMRNPIAVLADRIASDYQLLCFDEFVVIDIADAMTLGLFFQALFERGVVVIATSNVEPDRLYWQGVQRDQFLPAIAAIKANMMLFKMESVTDYRRMNDDLMRARYLVLPDDEYTWMKARFDALVSNDTIFHEPLSIHGRSIDIIASSHTVLWCHFKSLCEGPRAVSDYLTLSKRYRTLCLSYIPLMDVTHDNEARRFIHLVDACYDKKCLIIASAQASIEGLYTGTRVSHEFQRTVSRLIEMQTWSWEINDAP